MAEKLLYSTVRIFTEDEDGSSSTASGFFLEFNGFEFIVTNKHVIEFAKTLSIMLSVKSEVGDRIHHDSNEFVLESVQNKYLRHPDEDIDLVIIPYVYFRHKYPEAKTYYMTIKEDKIPTDKVLNSFDVFEDVIMIGCPDNIWDDYNNLPIVRKGFTASSLKFDYDGKREFLIDCPVYGGSSGSMVFNYDYSIYDSAVGRDLKLGAAKFLIGIVYAYYKYSASGELVKSLIPSSSKLIVDTPIPNGLGLVIKSTEILKFEPLINKWKNENLELIYETAKKIKHNKSN